MPMIAPWRWASSMSRAARSTRTRLSRCWKNQRRLARSGRTMPSASGPTRPVRPFPASPDTYRNSRLNDRAGALRLPRVVVSGRLALLGEHLGDVARRDGAMRLALFQRRRAAKGLRRGVHLRRRRLRTQRADSQFLARVMLERIEIEEPHRVLIGDFVDLLVCQVVDAVPKMFGRFGPQRIGMRIVAFIGDHILADKLQALQTE